MSRYRNKFARPDLEYVVEGKTMTQKFNPAPADKHAEDPKKAIKADETKSKLEEGLKETFPASDPVSASQPKKK